MHRTSRGSIAFALAVGFLLSATGLRWAQAQVAPPLHVWFNLDVEFGGGGYAGQGSGFYYQGIRSGVSLVDNWRFYSLLATVETFNFNRYALGVQLDLADVTTGISASVGPVVSLDNVWGAKFGLGVKIFHVEAELLFDKQIDVALLGVLRIPIGNLFYAKWGGPKKFTIPAPGGRH